MRKYDNFMTQGAVKADHKRFKLMLDTQQSVNGFKALLNSLALIALEAAETVAAQMDSPNPQPSPELQAAAQDIETFLRYQTLTKTGRLPESAFELPLGKLLVWAWLVLHRHELIHRSTAARMIFGVGGKPHQGCYIRMNILESQGRLTAYFIRQPNGVCRWMYRLPDVQQLRFRPPRRRRIKRNPKPDVSPLDLDTVHDKPNLPPVQWRP